MIKKRVGIEPQLESGADGQFDVIVDGDVVARRGGNRLTRGFGLGYPNFDQVVAVVEERRG